MDGYVYKKTQFNRNSEEFEEHCLKLWISTSLTNILIEEAHSPPNKFHIGISKTLQRLRQLYFWPKMATQVKEYIAKCEACKTCKPCNQILPPRMGSQTITERPFQRIYIDFLGPYARSCAGNNYILIVLDHMSKFVCWKSLRNANAKKHYRIFNCGSFKQIWSRYSLSTQTMGKNSSAQSSKTWLKTTASNI